ncbi:MAG: hypothetical protein EU540_03175 [Promethearchaeota archaeon]|nr:MAG: hypothetical protein EU540_03175 [Candidatus Lokiarchaeota archaeon]
MKILQDIWILTNSGVVLFNRVFDPQLKTQLFGALMSALNSFAERLAEGGLSNFELSDKRFIIMKKNDFLYVANSSTKVKPKRVIMQLEMVAEKFFELYPVEWFKTEWDNEVSTFADFEKEIKDLMEDPVKTFWESF